LCLAFVELHADLIAMPALYSWPNALCYSARVTCATQHRAEVDRVLAEIGAADVPQILVFNKSDLLEQTRRPLQLADWVELHPGQRCARVFASAVTGAGLPELRQAIAAHALAERGAAADGHVAAAGIAEALSSSP
jgi:50S ribosomal subunit-associated GTPase HflX